MRVIIQGSVFVFLILAVSGFDFFQPKQILRSLHLKNRLSKLKDNLLRNGIGPVKHMAVEAEDAVSSLFDLGSSLSPNSKNLGTSENKDLKRKLLGFSYQPCGPKDQVIKVKKLSVLPDPIYFPGDLKLSFDIEFMKTIPNNNDFNAKLMLDVKTKSGGSWINIPCLGSLGSCTYKDICGQLKAVQQCPPELVAAGIPCHCPFQKTDYHLENMDIEIDASVFLAGQYRMNVTFFNKQGSLACYKGDFTIG